MPNDIEDVIRCATECMEQELSRAHQQDVLELLQGRAVDGVGVEPFDDDEYNAHKGDGRVTIQFHDLYERRFGVFLEALAKLGYTYTVDSMFEAPPVVRVTNRATEPVTPIVDDSMVEAVTEAMEGQPEIRRQTMEDAVQLIMTRAREFPRAEGMDVDAEFIVTHALEDAGVGREERFAIIDDVFR